MIWTVHPVEVIVIPSVVMDHRVKQEGKGKVKEGIIHLVDSNRNKPIRTSKDLTQIEEVILGVNNNNKAQEEQSIEIVKVTITSSIAIQTNMKRI